MNPANAYTANTHKHPNPVNLVNPVKTSTRSTRSTRLKTIRSRPVEYAAEYFIWWLCARLTSDRFIVSQSLDAYFNLLVNGCQWPARNSITEPHCALCHSPLLR